MNAKLSSLKSHFTHWREWELNPIVIKELRQGVRSWTVTGMLVLFLVILLLASFGFLISESFEINANMRLGGQMFSVFVAILAGASIFFIPLYTGVRVSGERQENNPDLLYVSTLSPARIILGKFLCSAYIVLLFFSACMPFMAFTNLLRGVDLPTIFFILGFLFLVVCLANMVAIFFACLPLSRPFKFLFVLYGIFQSIFIVIPMVQIGSRFMGSGVGAMMTGRDFWINTLSVVALDLAITGLFFVLSVALISPPSSNRALPVRLYLTAFWLVGGALALWWVRQSGDAERIMAWTAPSLCVMILALLVTISNGDQLSLRVRRKIPTSMAKRLVAFLFFNGAAGGLVWLAGLFAVTYLVTVCIHAGSSANPLSDDDQRIILTLGGYCLAYGLTALLIHRKFFARRPPKMTGLIAILLAGAWALAPAIFLFFANQLSWKSVEGLQLGNIFNLFYSHDNSQIVWHECFAFGWLIVIVLINARWFWRQWQNFRPPAPAAPPVQG